MRLLCCSFLKRSLMGNGAPAVTAHMRCNLQASFRVVNLCKWLQRCPWWWRSLWYHGKCAAARIRALVLQHFLVSLRLWQQVGSKVAVVNLPRSLIQNVQNLRQHVCTHTAIVKDRRFTMHVQ